MDRPSKKDIKASVDRLKDKPSSAGEASDVKSTKLASKKSSQRIRKQGVN
jgi:hypothetical protein